MKSVADKNACRIKIISIQTAQELLLKINSTIKNFKSCQRLFEHKSLSVAPLNDSFNHSSINPVKRFVLLNINALITHKFLVPLSLHRFPFFVLFPSDFSLFLVDLPCSLNMVLCLTQQISTPPMGESNKTSNLRLYY